MERGQNSCFSRAIALLSCYGLQKHIFTPEMLKEGCLVWIELWILPHFPTHFCFRNIIGFEILLPWPFHLKLPLFLHILHDLFFLFFSFRLHSSHLLLFFFFYLIHYALFLLMSPSSLISWLHYNVLIASRLMVNVCNLWLIIYQFFRENNYYFPPKNLFQEAPKKNHLHIKIIHTKQTIPFC